MKTYEVYKESRLDWNKKIPTGWDLFKIGRTFQNIGSGTTPKSTNERFYEKGIINWLNTGDLNDGFIVETSKKVTPYAIDKNSALKIHPKDSIVIALYGATIGKLGHLQIEATTNQACCVISNSDKITQRFLFYYFLGAREYIISKSYGGGQPNISQELIKQLYIPSPSLKEQTQIANYLDHKTQIIDALIEKKEQLIKKLQAQRQAIINEAVTKGLNPNAKMKDSGIEWLGEIPEHWDVSFLKRFTTKITDGAHHSPKTQFEGRNYISVKDVNEFGEIDLINCKKIQEDDFELLVRNGCQPAINDVLLTKDGTIGRAAIVKENNFVILSSLGLISPDERKLNSQFLRYFLISDLNVTQMFSLIAGAALTRLTIDKIKHLIVTKPSLSIQEEIVDYLNSTISIFDEAIKKSKIQIKKLKSYRQSIIREAVTGKIDVRDWQPK